MRLKYIASALGLILMDIGLVTFIPILIALYYKDFNSILPFFSAGMLSLLVGKIMRNSVKNKSEADTLNDIKKAEALVIVSVSWIVFGIVSAIPYLFYGLSPIDSLFESVSGITTTGATILQHFDYPKAMIFWRSFTQWIGGMGIIVLFVAILPQFAVAGRQMFFAEAPGPTEDKITPRIKNTASALWLVYAGVTLACILCLWFAGMNLFDCICNSMSTMSAGGFSPNARSLEGYGSNLIIWIISIFMFLAGSSYVLQSRVLTKRKLSLFWKNEEFRCYTLVILFFSLLTAVFLIIDQNFSIFHSITASVYQVLSLATSTGSASEDFQLWSFNAKAVLFISMFISSCAGSAGGGVKMTRWIIIYKYIKNELYKILHPSAVLTVKIDNIVVATDVVKQTIFFMFCYFIIWGITAVILTLLEHSALIGLASSISSLGDIGPGFGNVIGPMGSYATLRTTSKAILIFNMLVGRLEIIPFLVLSQKDLWKLK